MKKSFVLMALVLQGLFTLTINLSAQSDGPSAIWIHRDETLAPAHIDTLYYGTPIGRVIIDTTASDQEHNLVDSFYIAIEASPYATLSIMTNWYITDGSTQLGTISTAPASTVITENMTVGAMGVNVFELQRYLNSDTNTQIAVSGKDSPGHETGYYGNSTKAAVIAFQSEHGLPATGFVGPLTRSILNSLGDDYNAPHAIGQMTGLQYALLKNVATLSVRTGYGIEVPPTNVTFSLTAFLPQAPLVPLLPARIDMFTLSDGPAGSGTKVLNLFGTIKPNTAYQVEASTNLTDWKVVGQVTPTDSTILKEPAVGLIGDEYKDKAFFRLHEMDAP
jgi:peptidoglycan hydrolase-like protein with peptidoglycan-binding domain